MKKRLLYLDVLNIICIIAVIALHCNGIVHLNPYVRAWNTSLIVEVLCYFAVPVFFMISGANLMIYREKYDTKTFFKKRLIKVGIPLIVWSIIMLIWKTNTKEIMLEKNNIMNIIRIILSNGVEGTYYYLFSILGIYLTMPLFSLLAKQEYRKTLWLICILYFIINSFLSNILPLFDINIYGELSIQIGQYIIYIFLGYLLSTEEINKKNIIILVVLTIAGLLYHYFTRFYFSKTNGFADMRTAGYKSWHAILQACLIFIIVKKSNIIKRISENKKICEVIAKISDCSFGIYLIHLIIKHYIAIYIFDGDIYSWKFRIIGIFLVYFLSLLIVYFIKKIPILKRIVP